MDFIASTWRGFFTQIAYELLSCKIHTLYFWKVLHNVDGNVYGKGLGT